MNNLTSNLYYATRVNNPYHVTPVLDLQALADVLPHGSGIDGDWFLDVVRNGDVIVTGDYHRLNENGYYDGWTKFHARIYRAKKTTQHALTGLREGQFQTVEHKGRIYLSDVRGAGTDLNEYLREVLSESLSALVSRQYTD